MEWDGVIKLGHCRRSVVQVCDLRQQQAIAIEAEQLGQAQAQQRCKRPSLNGIKRLRRSVSEGNALLRCLVQEERQQVVVVWPEWAERSQGVLEPRTIHGSREDESEASGCSEREQIKRVEGRRGRSEKLTAEDMRT